MSSGNDQGRVEELYDDADFYEQSLKEFLESRGGGGGAAGLAAHAARPKKRRKAVDRRASKGRKLRYHVQQPLVNFVAPVEMEVPAWAEKLFQRLFADD
jgi:protein AATF/BFR2